jgi:cell division protein FtsW
VSKLDNFFSTFKGDRSIWLIVVLLSLFSIMAVYSSSSLLAYQKHTDTTTYLIKHTSLILIAFGFMWFMHNISYQYYSGLYKLLLPLSIIALIYASLFGAKINDAGRWIKIPFINQTFQASDLAKLALMLYLARHISVNQTLIKDFKKGFLPMLLVTLTIVFLVFLENISTSIMILITAFIVMFLGRVRFLHFFGTVFVGLIFVALGYYYIMNAPEQFLFKRLSTAKSRLQSFSESKKSFKDVNYQVKQANIAIARGGIIPLGPGNSSQKNFLPNAFSDYVYAIIIEEWGILGGLFLLFLYLALLFRVIMLVMKSPNTFGAILALGLGMSIVIQAFTNMAVNVGILPTTGVTLPLVSMGGSSIVFVAIALGIILSVSRSVQDGELGKSPSKENYFDDLELQLSNYKSEKH